LGCRFILQKRRKRLDISKKIGYNIKVMRRNYVR